MRNTAMLRGLLLLALACGPAAAQTPRTCEVPPLVGATQGGVDGVMRVVNTGRECGFRVWFRPAEPRQQFQALTLHTPPGHGSVRLDNPLIAYTPRPGFVGTDRFMVATQPSGMVRITVTVTAP